MTCVVDTNVLAYFLLKTGPFHHEAQELWARLDEAWAPDSWRTEFLNVLWLAVRAGTLENPAAERRLIYADRLLTRTCSVSELKRAALRLAAQYNHPAYDTVFVALALREGVPLATYDRRLLKSFPGVARRPSEFLGP